MSILNRIIFKKYINLIQGYVTLHKINSCHIIKCISVLFFIVGFEVQPAWSLNIRATPWILLDTGWDSNIQSTIDNQISDVVCHVSPGLFLSADILDTTINLSGSFMFDYYIDNPDLNSYSRNGVYGLSVTRPIQVTQKLTFTPDARYFKQNDLYVRNSNILNSPSIAVSNQAYPVSSSTLTQWGVGGVANYNMSASSRVVISGLGSRDMYSSAGLLDTTFLHSFLGYEYRVTERNYFGPFLSSDLSRFSNGQNSNIYTGGIGLSYQLSNYYTISLSGGGSRWFLDQDQAADFSQNGWAPYATIDFRYDVDTWRANIGGSYRTQVIGGFQSVAKTIYGYASILKNVTGNWSVFVGTSYQKNISITDTNNLNYYIFSQARINYQPTQNVSAYLSGTNMLSEFTDENNYRPTINRTSIFIGLDLRKTYTIF